MTQYFEMDDVCIKIDNMNINNEYKNCFLKSRLNNFRKVKKHINIDLIFLHYIRNENILLITFFFFLQSIF